MFYLNSYVVNTGILNKTKSFTVLPITSFSSYHNSMSSLKLACFGFNF